MKRGLVIIAACGLVVSACGSSESSSNSSEPASTAVASTLGASTSSAPTAASSVDTSAPGAGVQTTGASSTPAVSGGTVTIGVSAPDTGPYASEGNPLENGVKYAADEINDAGGFVVDGKQYQLQVDSIDDTGTQAGAIQTATELVTDNHAIAIFGPIGPLAPPVADLLHDQNALMFASSSSVAAVAGPPAYPNVFITIAGLAARVSATVESIVKYAPQAKTVAVLAPDDQTSAAVLGPLKQALSQAGLTATDYLYPTGTTDLSTVLTRIQNDKPDVIFEGWAPPDQKSQNQQLDAAGIPKTTTLFLYAGTIANCKDESGGRPCIAHPLSGADLSTAGLSGTPKEFVDGYLKWSGRAALPASFAPLLWTYDYVYLLTEAMSKSGSIDDATKIGDALRSGVSRDGLLGNIAYGTNNFPVFGFDVSLVAPDGTVTTSHFQ